MMNRFKFYTTIILQTIIMNKLKNLVKSLEKELLFPLFINFSNIPRLLLKFKEYYLTQFVIKKEISANVPLAILGFQ